MNHLQFWNISESPFTIRDGRGFYGRGSVDEAIARIGFLIQNNQRMGLLVGPQGIGRTTTLRNLRVPLSESTGGIFSHLVYFSSQGLSAAEVPGQILRTLRTPIISATQLTLEDQWRLVEDEFAAIALQGEQIVLLVDDVHSASPSLQATIAKLIQMQGEPTCVLAYDDTSGEPISDWILAQSDLRIELPQWDLAQTADYFEFATDRVGAVENLFESQAITRVQELANGRPRRISQLAELALVAGAVHRVERITADLIEQVVDEIPGLDTFSYLSNDVAF